MRQCNKEEDCETPKACWPRADVQGPETHNLLDANSHRSASSGDGHPFDEDFGGETLKEHPLKTTRIKLLNHMAG